MGKNKDDIWLDSEIKKIKDEKRELCQPISDSEYNKYSIQEGQLNNKTIKKMKDDLKRKKRSVKRANKQFAEKEMEEEILKYELGKEDENIEEEEIEIEQNEEDDN